MSDVMHTIPVQTLRLNPDAYRHVPVIPAGAFRAVAAPEPRYELVIETPGLSEASRQYALYAVRECFGAGPGEALRAEDV